MTFTTFKLCLSAKIDQYDKDTNSLESKSKPTELEFDEWWEDFTVWLDNNPEDPNYKDPDRLREDRDDRPHDSPTDGETEDA